MRLLYIKNNLAENLDNHQECDLYYYHDLKHWTNLRQVLVVIDHPLFFANFFHNWRLAVVTYDSLSLNSDIVFLKVAKANPSIKPERNMKFESSDSQLDEVLKN